MRSRTIRWVLSAAGALSVLPAPLACRRDPPARPVESATYVAASTCGECHREQQAAWVGSDHDLAMQDATPASVLGDFGDARITVHGVTSTFRRDGESFVVNTDAADGVVRDFTVRHVFGVRPLQQYLVEGPRGRLQALPLAWDVAERRWFHLYDEPIPAGDALHWTGPQFTWNFMCADCHSTGLRKHYDAPSDTYHTTFADIDVGCQACHGPGSAHVAWARRPAAYRGTAGGNGLTVHLRQADAHFAVDACASCHSRRQPIDERPLREGETFLDHHVPELLHAPLYFADGQSREEVYEYGSFLQSRMYARGVRCTDCHDPHGTGLKASGNALCVRCHRPDPPAEFAMPAPGVYDAPGHHFHAPGTPGSNCVDCHMPQRTYMQIDPRRDHGFRVPRPDLAARTGAPDACQACHADRPAGWAAERVAQWFPASARRRQPHFGEAMAAAARGEPGAAAALRAVFDDAQQAPIVRATALAELSRSGASGLPALLGRALAEREPIVRRAAVEAVAACYPREAPASEQHAKRALTEPLLGDPVRAVRVEAARVYAELPAALRTASAYGPALAEYTAQLDLLADRPEGGLNRALLAESQGDAAAAEAAYRRAIALDAWFAPARFNLVQLLAGQRRLADAERELHLLLERLPDSGDAHYSLGLLLAETDRLAEAEEHLAAASRAFPERARVIYNHALALQHLDRRGEAEAELVRAAVVDDRDPAIARALAIFYAQEQRFAEALPHAQRWLDLSGDPAATTLLQQIERGER